MDMTENTIEREREQTAEIEAQYALEAPARCHHCNETLTEVHVIRMLRTKVNFTSSLSRRGYAVICPSCRGFLPASIG